MSTSCVTPTFTEVEPIYEITAADPPPCIPDTTTDLIAIQTEDVLFLLTEADEYLVLED